MAARSESEKAARAVRTNQERKVLSKTFGVDLAEFNPKVSRISS
jgi:hypothetical protein